MVKLIHIKIYDISSMKPKLIPIGYALVFKNGLLIHRRLQYYSNKVL